MNSTFILTIVVVGLSGVIAQILLLRELLVSFYGNELTIGIVLANWVISEAIGVLIAGKLIDKIKNKIRIFVFLQILFSISVPVSIYLARTFKEIIGIPFGESIGLSLICLSSLFIILPVAFSHGALFSTCTKVYSLRKEAASSIGEVYSFEMLGTILGGVILTYAFIPFLNSFQIAFILVSLNLAVSSLFLSKYKNQRIMFFLVAGIALVLLLFLSNRVEYIQRFSIKKQWGKAVVLENRNSIYGNVALIKEKEQYTLFYNGIPVITEPYPNVTFAEEFGNFPLLFHRSPKNVLVISAGAGGLINEILKHPIKKLDYAEIDPLIIKILKKYPTRLTQAELSDRRVNIINLDGRFFLREYPKLYDVILIGLSNQSDLSTNRLFTKEFFSLSKSRLNPDGIFAFWLPGSLTYLSPELRDLNACILNALRLFYRYIRIVPGDYNMYFASDDEAIMKVAPDLIWQRISQRNIKSKILIPKYLDYRLSKVWLDWFMQKTEGATKKINQDLKPAAVFQMLIFWNKKFSPFFAGLLERFKILTLGQIAWVMIFLTALLLKFSNRKKNKNFVLAYSIATTGFFGMLSTLILTFSFQVFYGYLYYWIGLLVSIFMSGIAAGSIFITRSREKAQNRFKLFVALEVLIIAFACLMGIVLIKAIWLWQSAPLILGSLFLLTGILMGAEFPLAGKIFLRGEDEVGETTGILYAADLIGGWVAGVFGGIIFIPVLGLFNSCMLIVIIKLSSLVLLVCCKDK